MRPLLLICLLTVGGVRAQQNLVIVMVDGFANHYLNQERLTGFETLIDNGVRAVYLEPEWPSISFPNWYTVATGQHVEKHGITGNFMYDKRSGKKFNIGMWESDYDPYWWTESTPFWITALTQNVPVSCYWWAGCQVKFPQGTVHDTLPYKGSYKETLSFPDRQSEIVEKLKSGRARFVLVYYELVDAVGHDSGPNSKGRRAATTEISDILDTFQKKLQSAGLWDNTNLIVVSDHGMAEIHTKIYVDKCMDMNAVELLVDRNSFMQVFVKSLSKQRELYKNLTDCHPNVKAYMKNELPEEFHYRKGRFLPNIILVADIGYAIFANSTAFPGPVQNASEGMHGWNNKDEQMRGIFLARGPCFKKKVQHRWLRMVDVYQIVLKILNLSPSHPHDGSWPNVKDMMQQCQTVDHSSSSSVSNISASLIILFFSVLCRCLFASELPVE